MEYSFNVINFILPSLSSNWSDNLLGAEFVNDGWRVRLCLLDGIPGYKESKIYINLIKVFYSITVMSCHYFYNLKHA